MRATKTSAWVAAGALALAALSGCLDCAYGPTEIRDVPLTVGRGAPIGGFIEFPSGSKGVFRSVEAHPPAGVTVTLADDGLRLTGSIAQAGSYSFQILVRAEEGEACAPWARYDVALTVQ